MGKIIANYVKEIAISSLPTETELVGNTYYWVLSPLPITIEADTFAYRSLKNNVIFINDTVRAKITLSSFGSSPLGTRYIVIIGLGQHYPKILPVNTLSKFITPVTWTAGQAIADISSSTINATGYNSPDVKTYLMNEIRLVRKNANNWDTALPQNYITKIEIMDSSYVVIHSIINELMNFDAGVGAQIILPSFYWQAKTDDERLIFTREYFIRVYGETNGGAATYVFASFNMSFI